MSDTKVSAADFPTPAIAQKAEAALVVYREIRAGFETQQERDGAAFVDLCGRGDLAAAKDAIEKGFDVSAWNMWGLIAAVRNGQTEIVRLLFAHVTTLRGSCSDRIILDAARNGHTEMTRLFIAEHVNSQKMRNTALVYAATGGHAETVRQLIEDGADVESRAQAFGAAAALGHIEIIRWLIEHDADVTARDNEAIIRAAAGGYTEIVRLLIEHGADVRAQNNSALYAAAKIGQTEIIRLLVKHGADVTAGGHFAVTAAAAEGHAETVCLLFAYGADAAAEGCYALYYAAAHGHTGVVRLLIERDEYPDIRKNEALREAAAYGFIETVCLLIDHGADVTAQSNVAIQSAARRGHYKAVQLLIDRGAQETALHREDRQGLADYRAHAPRWHKVLRCEPLPHLLQEDPALFKGTCYASVRRILEAEGYGEPAVSVMAFHTAALFQSPERVLQYLKQWGGPGGQPLHNLVQMIGVPSVRIPYRHPDLKNWADGVLKCGPSMAKLVKFADKVLSPVKTDDGRTWSMVKTREECARFSFRRAKENPALAALCFEHSVDEKDFEQALEIVQGKQSATKNIPEIDFRGEAFGMPGGRFRRLADDDIRGLFLGEMTDCCQSIGSPGKECAKHGFTSAEGGFYVVENAKSRIVGQSWAWRGAGGELCLDSLETLGNNVTGEQWLGIINAFRAALSTGNDHKVTALTIGTGGATRDSCPGLTDVFTEAANVVPKDYKHKGYRDSHTQRLVWRAPDV